MELKGDNKFQCWGVLEIMGKVSMAGKITEQNIGSITLLRIDVPDPNDRDKFSRTSLFAGNALFGLHVTDEEVARAAAASHRSEPEWEYRVEKFLKRMQERLAPRQDEIPFDPT